MNENNPTYYACAFNPKVGKIGLLAVVKIKGQPIRQSWTGEEFPNEREAVAVVEHRNRELMERA